MHIMLIDASLRQPGRYGKSVAIDFTIVTPVAEFYCKEAARKPLHTAGLCKIVTVYKDSQAYKKIDDIYAKSFVLESARRRLWSKSSLSSVLET